MHGTIADNREVCAFKSSIISFCSSKLKAVFILIQCSVRKQVRTHCRTKENNWQTICQSNLTTYNCLKKSLLALACETIRSKTCLTGYHKNIGLFRNEWLILKKLMNKDNLWNKSKFPSKQWCFQIFFSEIITLIVK